MTIPALTQLRYVLAEVRHFHNPVTTPIAAPLGPPVGVGGHQGDPSHGAPQLWHLPDAAPLLLPVRPARPVLPGVDQLLVRPHHGGPGRRSDGSRAVCVAG